MTDDLDKARLDELEWLAKAATAGPWQNGADDLEGVVSLGSTDDGNVVCVPPDDRMELSNAKWPANAAFIAAANPQTVLALISTLHQRGEEAERANDRVVFLEDNLLIIAERDRHYRTPPKPKPDGGLRGWAGHRAVWALTGMNGSYVGDDDVKAAVMIDRQALSNTTGKRGEG